MQILPRISSDKQAFARLNMDIQITPHYNRDKRNICSVSIKGRRWMHANMTDDLLVVVDAEAVSDLVKLMKENGLTVEGD